jgi:putative DNA primase/helicase
VATDRYHAESDTLTRFLAECCLINPHSYATTGELFQRWCKWARSDGAEPGSSKAFGQALDRAGYPIRKGTAGRRLRHGIGLPADTRRATGDPRADGCATDSRSSGA